MADPDQCTVSNQCASGNEVSLLRVHAQALSMRRISVQPNNSEGIGEIGNVNIAKSIGAPVGTPSKPPTKIIGEKRYAARGGNHGQLYPYYPIDYWCIFFLGFCVGKLVGLPSLTVGCL